MFFSPDLLSWWGELPKIWQLFLYHHRVDYHFVADDLEKFDAELSAITKSDLPGMYYATRLSVIFSTGTVIFQDLDLSPLGKLPNLAELLLVNTQLRDIKPIAEMKALKTLVLSGPSEWEWNADPPYYPFEFNRADLSPLAEHPTLSHFHIHGNAGFLDIDLEILSQLKTLRALTLCNTEISKITNLKPLGKSKHLHFLDIAFTSIQSLDDIWHLPLRKLIVPKHFDAGILYKYRQKNPRCMVIKSKF